jgi:beta-glucosidase
LSYTTFEYSNPQISATTLKDTDGLSVSVDITNTGKVAGKEIVQIYVHDKQSKLARPPKELKGFAKVALQPGETKTVSVKLDFRAFAYYHPRYSQWITEDGEFEILIGASAADIRFRETVTLESTVELPCVLDRESTIREWLEDPRGNEVFGPIFQMMQAQMAETFGDAEEGQEHIGMDTMGFMMEMPLLAILHFQEEALPMGADEMVDMLLGRVYGTIE